MTTAILDRNNKIAENMNLVYFTINKYYPMLQGDEDMYQIGMIGLIRAVDTFDEENGSEFSTYAAVCIRNEVCKELRKKKQEKPSESIEDMFRPEVLGDDDVDFFDYEGFGNTLNDTEKKILNLKYLGYSEHEIAPKIGVSHQRINMITKGIRKHYNSWSKVIA